MSYQVENLGYRFSGYPTQNVYRNSYLGSNREKTYFTHMLKQRHISSALQPWLFSAFGFRCMGSIICLLLLISDISKLLRLHKLSRVVRKPAFCICENKDTDQLCGNRTADQRLCFRYIDSTIPLLSNC